MTFGLILPVWVFYQTEVIIAYHDSTDVDPLFE